PYSILGLSATWDVTKYVSMTGGVDNVFDKRHWRAGTAQTTGGATGTMYGAGAETYNESGRTWYLSVTISLRVDGAEPLTARGHGVLRNDATDDRAQGIGVQ
ncbi:TonB-dependent receptor, partial [Klebsiella pneumoniae]|uniref:TonB-dependent receptor n=1 Tax=Klebsiella pneumoniae TaxID=573 RepID=UPI00210DBA08